MDKTFIGYTKKSKSDIKKLWDDGIICFDTNVLLNLYRYSDETRNTFLNVVKKLGNKIWLPHQAALEYNRNRYEVIAAQEKEYKGFIEQLSQIQEDLKSKSKPPFLSASVHTSLNRVFEKVNKEVEESIKRYCDFLEDDPIYGSISDLFKNKISKAYTETQLKEIYKLGEERYPNKIPPGYEDEKTKKDQRKYGDLILWHQIIGKAKESKLPIILVTDDRKTDWWWKLRDGRNMGPRQELLEEMKTKGNVDFYMYSSERFLSYGQSYLEERINKKAFEEIKEFRRLEAKSKRVRTFNRLKAKGESYKIARDVDIKMLLDRKKEIQLELESIRLQIEELINDPSTVTSTEKDEFFKYLSTKQDQLIAERAEIKRSVARYGKEKEIGKLGTLYRTKYNFEDDESIN